MACSPEASTGGATGGIASGGRSNDDGGAGGASTTSGPRWVGRVDASNPDAVRFAWDGAGVVAIVAGSTIATKLRTEGTNTVY